MEINEQARQLGLIQDYSSHSSIMRTAFFLANEYARMMGVPSLVSKSKEDIDEEVPKTVAEYYIEVAAGRMDTDTLSKFLAGAGVTPVAC